MNNSKYATQNSNQIQQKLESCSPLKEGVCLEHIGKIWKVSAVNGGKICAVAKSWDPLPPSQRCQPTDLTRH